MFSWFKNLKRKKIQILKTPTPPLIKDEMEECLWEIKEEYDLPTEEIDLVVNLKRQNIDYMHKHIKKRRKNV